MGMLRVQTCTICGQETLGDGRWFLVMEDPWQDKLTILHWNDRLAAAGVHCACSPEHMQEIVVHWMTTGTLDYPFARIGTPRGMGLKRAVVGSEAPTELFGARRIGELTVHRESMERALHESPQSLRTILDALSSALQAETGVGKPARKVSYAENLSMARGA